MMQDFQPQTKTTAWKLETKFHEIFEIFLKSFFKVSVEVSSKKTNIQILITG